MVIIAYGIPLAPFTSFEYLGIVLSAADDDWPVVVSNLWKSHQKWERMTRVLRREVVDDRTLVQIYLTVFQSVMLYGLETWVMTPRIGRVLGGFHHRVARRLTGRQPRQVREIVWVYPPLEDAMTEAGFQDVDTYVSRRHNTVAQFIATRPIMDLCLAADQRPGPRVSKRWWEQDGVGVEGMRTAAREAERMEGEEDNV